MLSNRRSEKAPKEHPLIQGMKRLKGITIGCNRLIVNAFVSILLAQDPAARLVMYKT